jgi:hypothetical protein
MPNGKYNGQKLTKLVSNEMAANIIRMNPRVPSIILK